MLQAELFIFGAILGSFLNVIAVRYDPDRFLFSRAALGGRSHCPHCKKQLRWYELVPLFSFIVQGGRCRNCKARLSWQYPFSEIVSGVIVATVFTRFTSPFFPASTAIALQLLWTAVFLLLFLMSLVDIHHYLIPDELSIGVGVLGIVIAAVTPHDPAFGAGSFVGAYALLFPWLQPWWLDRLMALAAAAALFGLLILVTRGRGMGMGDLKLGLVLALAFGWPDNVILYALAFVTGALVSVAFLLRGRKSMKSFLPFGPFMALAALVIFFWGEQLVHWYFSLFPA